MSDRTLRKRKLPSLQDSSLQDDVESSKSSSDDDPEDADFSGENFNENVCGKRKKRKIEVLSSIPCKLPRLSETKLCCIHMDDSRSENPQKIGSKTAEKMTQVLNLLKPITDEQIEKVGPQAKLIRKKLEAIPDVSANDDLLACLKCQNKVKKNFSRYKEKISKLNSDLSTVIVEPSKVSTTSTPTAYIHPPSQNKTRLRKNVLGSKRSQNRPGKSKVEATSTKSKSEILLPQDSCFICNSWRVYYKKKYHTKLSKVELSDKRFQTTMKKNALKRRDAAMLAILESYDVLAREGHYHKICYDEYRVRHEKTEKEFNTDMKEKFQELRAYVDTHVFGQSEIVTLDSLAAIYSKIDGNLNRASARKITKNKLVEIYKDTLSFESHPVDGGICFDSNLSPGQLALKVYHHRKAPKDIVREAGSLVREEVQKMFKSIESPPYPPRIQDLNRYKVPRDSLLVHLNSEILAGTNYDLASSKNKVKIKSMSEDHAYGVSNGKFKSPKHTSLAAFIRQHTRSKKVITVLNKLNHCISNDEMLSLETDWARSMREMEYQVPHDIVQNLPLAQGMDNFDLNQYTETGEGTDHVTQSLALQLIPENGNYQAQKIPEVSKTKERSLPSSDTHSTTYKLEKKQPSSYPAIDKDKLVMYTVESSQHQFDQFICEFSGFQSESEDGVFSPSYAGWTALQFRSMYKDYKVVIGYYPPYLKPMTDSASVENRLKCFVKCAEYANQPYTVVFADMDVVIRSQKILWMKQNFFKNKVIIVPGMMHTEMALLGAVGIMVDGSGFNDVLERTKVIKKNSLKGVLSGKNLNRSRECHRVFKTALSRRFIRFWIGSLDPEKDLKLIEAIQNTKTILHRFTVNEINESSDVPDFSELHNDSNLQHVFESFSAFKLKVRKDKLAGETGLYWLNYIDIMNEIEMLRRSVHLHDRYNLLQCIMNLAFLFFMFNKHNYARWILQFIYEQLNVDTLWPGAREILDQCGISSKRKSSSSLFTANDMLLEATINNESGRGQGCNFRGFGNIDGSSERIHLTRSFRVEMNDWLQDFVSTDDAPLSKSMIIHEETKPRKIIRRERTIKRVEDLLMDMCPVFCYSNSPELFSLSTGCPAPREVAETLLKCNIKENQMGIDRYNAVYVEQSMDFYETIKQTTYSTFVRKSRVYKVKGKKAEQALKDQRNVLGSISLLAQQEGYDMEKLLEYPFTELPPQISTPEGRPLTNCKSSLANHLMKGVETNLEIDPSTSGLIVDAQYFLHTYVKEFSSIDSQLKTYGDVGKFVLKLLMEQGNFPVIYFVTETYKDDSVKKFERQDRGSTSVLVGSVGLSSVRPMGNTWNAAMHCNAFKATLQQLLLQQFKSDESAQLLKDRKLYFTLDNDCFLLQSERSNKVTCIEVNDLYCDHEEPDTKVIFYASQLDPSLKTAVIKIADTDVVVNAIYHTPHIAAEVMILWGTKDYRKVFSARQIRENIGEDVSNSLIGLHVFTGNGKVSAISGLGKVNPFKKLQKCENLVKSFTNLGNTGKPSPEQLQELEEAACILYGRKSCTSIDKARYSKFNEVFQLKLKDGKPNVTGMDEARMPMCLRVLLPHIKRAAREAYIQKMALDPTPSLPPILESGYKLSSEGGLEVSWVADAAFPPFPGAD